MENFLWKCLVVLMYTGVAQGWGNNDKIKLTDVQVLTLRRNAMTNGRRSSPVPQVKCVGGTAGCNSFVPNVIQCYNRGSDGFDVQWECKADMDNKYRFGEVAINCEGYDYPDDPYVLKGSCGVEYTIDRVGGHHGDDSRYNSGYQQSHHGNYGHKKHHRRSSGYMSTFIMWGVLAFIGYYIYSTLTTNQNTTDNTQPGYQGASSSPPPPGFRPEYTTQDQTQYPGTSSSSTDSSSNYGGFWTGMGLGSVAGYLFGNRGHGNTGYYNRHNPYYNHGNSWFGGGNGWFGGNYGNSGNSGWFGNNHGNSGWFGSNHSNNGWFGSGSGSSSSWSSTHRRSGSSSSSSSGSRTASGFGGTKRR